MNPEQILNTIIISTALVSALISTILSLRQTRGDECFEQCAVALVRAPLAAIAGNLVLFMLFLIAFMTTEMYHEFTRSPF
ncbi:MAG: hypothetical protein ABIH21_02680 [Patescibacteria group bacterium]